MKIFFNVFLLLFAFSYVSAAQYLGGSADGFAYGIIAVACPPLTSTNVSLGGVADGFAYAIKVVACPPLISSNVSLGGNADGFAYGTLVVVCPPLVSTSVSTGGNADGFAYGTKIVLCPPLPSTNVSAGGAADGFAYGVKAVLCPPGPVTNVSFGGVADGFAYGTKIVVCPPLPSTNIFLGGVEDGFAYNSWIACAPLPVELLYFHAICDMSRVTLEWATASENNSSYFSVERTPDALSYHLIGTITAAGNSNQIKYYSIIDEVPSTGNIYYRLKQTDLNGSFKYFTPILSNCNNGTLSDVKITPNPNNGLFMMTGVEANTELTIYDPVGEKILTQSITTSNPKIDLRELSAGIYFLQLRSQDNTVTQKVIITR
jgi:hypothetical protein